MPMNYKKDVKKTRPSAKPSKPKGAGKTGRVVKGAAQMPKANKRGY